MSVAQDLETPEDGIFPPGDLYSDEPPLETDLHQLQSAEHEKQSCDRLTAKLQE